MLVDPEVAVLLPPPDEPPGLLVLLVALPVVVPAVLLQAANSSRSSRNGNDRKDIQRRECEGLLCGISMISPLWSNPPSQITLARLDSRYSPPMTGLV